MSKSLRDQLVEAGLASASSARKAEKQAQAKGKRSNRSNSGPDQPASRELARKAQAEKVRADRLRGRQQSSKAAERALRAEIRQLLTQHNQRASKAADDDVAYNFLHNKKIKRIYLPKAQVEQLGTGKLVVINDEGRYALVAKDIAERIAERDPRRIITKHHTPAAKADEEMDEYYKQFEVPDDLDW